MVWQAVRRAMDRAKRVTVCFMGMSCFDEVLQGVSRVFVRVSGRVSASMGLYIPLTY